MSSYLAQSCVKVSLPFLECCVNISNNLMRMDVDQASGIRVPDLENIAKETSVGHRQQID